MQSLQDKASEWSGVAAGDAFAIDELNVFEALGGTPQPFVDLSTNFYTRVYEDEEEWFREIFSGSKKEDAIRNQYEFLVQRMGGPPLFSQRRGENFLSNNGRKQRDMALDAVLDRLLEACTTEKLIKGLITYSELQSDKDDDPKELIDRFLRFSQELNHAIFTAQSQTRFRHWK